MAIVTRKTLVMAEIEVNYGVDPTPAAATNVMEATNVVLTPNESRWIDRGLVRPWFGANYQVLGDRMSIIEFDTELTPSGTADTPPAWGPLLAACGFDSTTVTSTSVTYATGSASIGSVTIYCYIDGILHKLLGCRGTVSLSFEAGDLPRARWRFMGRYLKPSDATFPVSPVFTAWQTPLVCNRVNTAMAVHSVNVNASSMILDMGNDVQYRNLFNQEDFVIVDRNVQGSVTMEMTTVATKDWFGVIEAGTTGALGITHGTVAGSRINVVADRMQLINPRYEDRFGVRFLTCDLRMVPLSGADDITVKNF